jgi:hypothetical protein
MSVNKGDSISFKVDSDTSNIHINIYRLGYYGGDGARSMVENLAPTGPTSQPDCARFADSGLIDCGNWAVTRSWTVPSTAVSGVYIANLTRNDTGGTSGRRRADVGHDLAGLQHLGRQQPLSVHRLMPAW